MHRRTNRFHLAASCLITTVSARQVVLPNAFANAPGTASGTLFATTERTYQVQYDPGQLAGVPVGSLINGIRMQLEEVATNWGQFPLQGGVTFSNFEINGFLTPTTTPPTASFPFGTPVAGGPNQALFDFWDGTAASAPNGVRMVRTLQTNQVPGSLGRIDFTPVGNGYQALSH